MLLGMREHVLNEVKGQEKLKELKLDLMVLDNLIRIAAILIDSTFVAPVGNMWRGMSGGAARDQETPVLLMLNKHSRVDNTAYIGKTMLKWACETRDLFERMVENADPKGRTKGVTLVLHPKCPRPLVIHLAMDQWGKYRLGAYQAWMRVWPGQGKAEISKVPLFASWGMESIKHLEDIDNWYSQDGDHEALWIQRFIDAMMMLVLRLYRLKLMGKSWKDGYLAHAPAVPRRLTYEVQELVVRHRQTAWSSPDLQNRLTQELLPAIGERVTEILTDGIGYELSIQDSLNHYIDKRIEAILKQRGLDNG